MIHLRIGDVVFFEEIGSFGRVERIDQMVPNTPLVKHIGPNGEITWKTGLPEPPTIIVQMETVNRPQVCECHERDSSFVCELCRSQGMKGYMEP